MPCGQIKFDRFMKDTRVVPLDIQITFFTSNSGILDIIFPVRCSFLTDLYKIK